MATTDSAVVPHTTTWDIDPAHSVAEFKVRHMMISNVKGQFSGIKGRLTLDDTDVTNSRIEASIEAASVSTRQPERDAHLKSADFFDAEKFPALTFLSSHITRGKDGELKVTGELTIHGVTRTVVFGAEAPSAPARDPYGSLRVGLSATAKISRKDFGLTWNAALETGGVLVGDEVAITLDVQFVKA
jgi:polyisoprenoid-binding protein YceI